MNLNTRDIQSTNAHSVMLCIEMEPFFGQNVVTRCGLVKATGGGAFRFADLFKEKLGVTLDKVEEMDSLVTGANFLLKVGSLVTVHFQ